MKVRRFTLTLTLALTLTTLILGAIPLIAEQKCKPDTRWEKSCRDGIISGYGVIKKEDNIVKAKAQAQAAQTADAGWYWIHAKVLPHSDLKKYNDQMSGDIDGYLHKTVNAKRLGQPKSNGYSYVSMWAKDDDEQYYSILIDLPD